MNCSRCSEIKHNVICFPCSQKMKNTKIAYINQLKESVEALQLKEKDVVKIHHEKITKINQKLIHENQIAKGKIKKQNMKALIREKEKQIQKVKQYKKQLIIKIQEFDSQNVKLNQTNNQMIQYVNHLKNKQKEMKAEQYKQKQSLKLIYNEIQCILRVLHQTHQQIYQKSVSLENILSFIDVDEKKEINTGLKDQNTLNIEAENKDQRIINYQQICSKFQCSKQNIKQALLPNFIRKNTHLLYSICKVFHIFLPYQIKSYHNSTEFTINNESLLIEDQRDIPIIFNELFLNYLAADIQYISKRVNIQSQKNILEISKMLIMKLHREKIQELDRIVDRKFIEINKNIQAQVPFMKKVQSEVQIKQQNSPLLQKVQFTMQSKVQNISESKVQSKIESKQKIIEKFKKKSRASSIKIEKQTKQQQSKQSITFLKYLKMEEIEQSKVQMNKKKMLQESRFSPNMIFVYQDDDEMEDQDEEQSKNIFMKSNQNITEVIMMEEEQVERVPEGMEKMISFASDSEKDMKKGEKQKNSKKESQDSIEEQQKQPREGNQKDKKEQKSQQNTSLFNWIYKIL